MLPDKDLNPTDHVLWWNSKFYDRIIHILDGHGNFGPSVLIVQHNELGYDIVIFLFKIKYLLFESRNGRLDGRFLWQGWLLEIQDFWIGDTVHLWILFYHTLSSLMNN